mgnify:CR=1 FL=1
MNRVFIIQPENNDILTQVSTDPLVSSVEILQVQVEPEHRRWKVLFAGKPRGTASFWQQLADQLTSRIPEIDQVIFQWEEQLEEIESDDSDQNYMENILKNFKGPEVNNTKPAVNNSYNGNGNRRSRSRNSNLLRPISEEPMLIRNIFEEEQGVTIAGEIIDYQQRTTRSGKILVTFDIYDRTDSITCKFFLDDEKDLPDLAVGKWVKVKGNVEFQAFDGELSLMVQRINEIEAPPGVQDLAAVKRVEFHLHTKMSGLDGTIDVEDVVKQAAEWGHKAVAVTDHGVVQAFPAAYYAGQKYGVKIIFGLEGYLIESEDDYPYHIVLLAKNKVGLKNLYKLVSFSHLDYFYRRPRIPRDVLAKHREGIIVGSACEAGEVYQAALKNAPNLAEIAKFYDYLEVQPLGNNEFLIGTEYVKTAECLKNINRKIIALGKDLNIPVIATGDVHFLRPEDSLYRTILLMGQGFEDAERQAPLYFRTTEEMLEEFNYLEPDLAEEIVITNPNKLADEFEDLTPIPQGLHPPIIPEAEESLKALCYKTAKELYGDPLPELVEKRLNRELEAIIGNGFAALYWTAHQLVKKSLEDGYLVGSRGSVGSSFAATMSGITEVNPLPPHYLCPSCKWSEFFTAGEVGSGVDLPAKKCPKCDTELNKDGFDIPFEVFMGFYGDKVPDIDLNFSGEYQATIQKYTEELFGEDHVFRAGTVGTLANKTAYGFVKKYLEEVNQTKRTAEINRLVNKLTGIRRTTGQHPGGMIVVPKDMEIYDFTPIQYPANDSKSGVITTHFEFSYIHDSLVKLDNLGHDGPTMARIFEDLSGISVTDIPLDDPETMKIFSGLSSLNVTEEQIGTPIGTLGIPEFGTGFTRQMLEEIRPKTFADLVAIMGLSHGTDVWLNNAQELIKNNVTDFANVIACRDDIMVYLIHKGLDSGAAFNIMEQVRKGRGLSEEDVALMKKHNVPDWYIDSCFKIKYMFPKAHAVAYAITAFRAAYFKVHYPAIFYAAYFSLKVDDCNANLMVAGEDTIREEMAKILAKGNEATAKDKNVYTNLEIVIEALARGITFLPIDLYKSHQTRFIPIGNQLLPPIASLEGVGINAAEAIVNAREEGEFLSKEDLRQRAKVTRTVIEALDEHGCLAGMPETNQLSLF